MAYTKVLKESTIRQRVFKRSGSQGTGNFDLSEIRTFTGSRSGAKVDSRETKIKAGTQAGSPFVINAYTIRSSPVYAKTRWSNPAGTLFDQDEFWGHFGDFQEPNHLTTVTDEMLAKVLSRVYGLIRARKTHINGLNTLGELRETLHMIKRPADALRKNFIRMVHTEGKTISAIRRMRTSVKRRDAFAKMVAGTTLEINFGWRPLFSEIRAIAEAIARFQTRPPLVDRVKSSITSPSKVLEILGKTQNQTGAYIYWERKRSINTEASIQFIVGLKTQVATDYSSVERFRDVFGLTTENILPTAYELTPWSWLADYFSNLGDIVEAVSTDTSSVAWIVRTDRQYTSQVDVCTGLSAKDNLSAAGYNLVSEILPKWESQLIRTTVNRSLPSSLGIPPIIFTHPGGSFGKLTNILSVMEQQRRSVRF